MIVKNILINVYCCFIFILSLFNIISIVDNVESYNFGKFIFLTFVVVLISLVFALNFLNFIMSGNFKNYKNHYKVMFGSIFLSGIYSLFFKLFLELKNLKLNEILITKENTESLFILIGIMLSIFIITIFILTTFKQKAIKRKKFLFNIKDFELCDIKENEDFKLKKYGLFSYILSYKTNLNGKEIVLKDIREIHLENEKDKPKIGSITKIGINPENFENIWFFDNLSEEEAVYESTKWLSISGIILFILFLIFFII